MVAQADILVWPVYPEAGGDNAHPLAQRIPFRVFHYLRERRGVDLSGIEWSWSKRGRKFWDDLVMKIGASLRSSQGLLSYVVVPVAASVADIGAVFRQIARNYICNYMCEYTCNYACNNTCNSRVTQVSACVSFFRVWSPFKSKCSGTPVGN